MADKIAADAARGDDAGPRANERHMHLLLIHDTMFVHHAMTAGRVAVVGGEDDERVLEQSAGAEVFDDAPDGIVELADHAVVAREVDGPLAPCPRFDAPVAQLLLLDERFAGEGFREIFPRRDGFRRIHRSERFAGQAGQVGLVVVESDVPWRIAAPEFPDEPTTFGGQRVRVARFEVQSGHGSDRKFRPRVVGQRVPARLVFRTVGVGRRFDISFVAVSGGVRFGVDVPLAEVSRAVTGVAELPHPDGVVRGRGRADGQSATAVEVPQSAMLLGHHAGEQCLPGRSADGERGVGRIELQSRAGEGVEVGGLDQRMAGEAEAVVA